MQTFQAIIVDPSTFVGLYEFVREATDSSNLDRPNESPDTSFTTAEGMLFNKIVFLNYFLLVLFILHKQNKNINYYYAHDKLIIV